jgi:hypothetical protein
MSPLAFFYKKNKIKIVFSSLLKLKMKKLLSSSSNNETASKKQAVIFLQFLSLIYKDFFCLFGTSTSGKNTF